MAISERITDHRALACSACVFLLLASVAACTYQPGTLLTKYPETSETVGCIDIAAEALDDKKAEGPAAKIFVANRCHAPVVVDYQTIFATVRYTDGHEGVVRIYDPNNTLKPVTLDALSRGWEAFEFHPDDPADDELVPEQLCLDVSLIDRKEPSTDARQICVATGSDLTEEQI